MIAKNIAFLRSRSLILRSLIVTQSFDQMAIADPNPIAIADQKIADRSCFEIGYEEYIILAKK